MKKKLKGEPIALAYYGRHNLPQPPQPEQPSISARINRNFYQSLVARGRTNEYIFNMIQPERREQFFKDVNTRFPFTARTDKPRKSWWSRIFS